MSATREPAPATVVPSEGDRPIIVEFTVRLRAIALPEPEGGYSVIVPALPGCFTEGDTLDQIQPNVAEAAQGWLDAQHDRLRVGAIEATRP